MFKLTTERLSLRHFHILDGDAMYRIFGDPEVMKYGDGVQTREWVDTWLRTYFERYYQAWGFGPYAVVENLTQDVIGYCGLFYFPNVNGRPEVEIGYRLVRPAWGHGYATEAARAVRDCAFTDLGIQRLIAIIDPSNIASIRVAEKLGMRYEQNVMFKGYTHSDHVYAITRTQAVQRFIISSKRFFAAGHSVSKML
jgi:ribosomal-protein-alanine N-acetyltransferase